MINRSNIRSYIDFLHYKKYDIGAKEDLLERWVNLSDFEITKQLSGLYQHWNISPQIAKDYEHTFLNKSANTAAVVLPPVVSPDNVANSDAGDYLMYTKESSNHISKFIAIALIFLGVIAGIFFLINRQTELTQKTEQLDQKIEQVDQAALAEQQGKAQREEEAQRAIQEKTAKIQAVKENIDEYVQQKVDYNYDATFGGIKNVRVSVRNNAEFKIEELTIRLSYIKKNGNLHETKDIFLYNIPPHKQIDVEGPSNNRGVRLEAKIVGVEISE